MNIFLNEQLKKFRKEKGNTQEELAEYLGITMQAVSKWERGEGYPDITLLPALADILKISIDELFGIKINTEPVFDLVENVPWDDDRQVRFAVYYGKKLMQQSAYELKNGTNQINIHFDYGKDYKINGICKLKL